MQGKKKMFPTAGSLPSEAAKTPTLDLTKTLLCVGRVPEVAGIP